MKIYTKTGDKGSTGLFGGKRISKDDIRIEAYGTIDELNSFIGLLNSTVDIKEYNTLLFEIQNRLFDMGSHLASDPDKNPLPSNIDDADIQELEIAMDNMENVLPELRNFILPGGSGEVSIAQVCRTICRRAERRVVTLTRLTSLDEKVVQYLNRLSDFFFVFARYLGHQKGIPEVIWKVKSKK
ncbi:MAG: cob(I)yrinic acid a,c-diamide adenosyltransferase [Saprospiraceae bacterium]